MQPDLKDNVRQIAHKMKEKQLGEQQPQGVPTLPMGPVPSLITVTTQLLTDGSRQVQMIFSTPQGINTFFLEPDAAEKIGSDLQDHARQARTDIIVPTNGHVRDDLKPEDLG